MNSLFQAVVEARTNIVLLVGLGALIYWYMDGLYARYGASGACLFVAWVMIWANWDMPDRTHSLLAVVTSSAFVLWLMLLITIERHLRRPLSLRETLSLPFDLAVYTEPSDVTQMDAHFSIIALVIFSFTWSAAAKGLFYLLDIIGGSAVDVVWYARVIHTGPPFVAIALALVIGVKLLRNPDEAAADISWLKSTEADP